MSKKIMLIALISIFAVSLSGCIKFGSSDVETTDLGGVFLSSDRFETWKHISQLMTPGATAGDISDSNIYFMRFDPSDEEAIYISSKQDGLYYSYNSGAGWNKAKNFPEGFLRDLVIDSKDKCTLYAGVLSRIYKSEDCARTWQTLWYSDNTDRQIAALGIDWYNPAIVYAGLTDGSFLFSNNHGETWQLVKQFNKRVNKIVVDPNDSRAVYVGVIGEGLYRTDDYGENWRYLNFAMKDFKSSNVYYDFDVAHNPKGTVIYASDFGLLRSKDGGTTWSEVKLNSSAGDEIIFSVAIDPKDANYFYYATDKALYKTIDGGQSWANKRMPTTRVAGELLIHPTKTNNIYMGVKEFVQ